MFFPVLFLAGGVGVMFMYLTRAIWACPLGMALLFLLFSVFEWYCGKPLSQLMVEGSSIIFLFAVVLGIGLWATVHPVVGFVVFVVLCLPAACTEQAGGERFIKQYNASHTDSLYVHKLNLTEQWVPVKVNYVNGRPHLVNPDYPGAELFQLSDWQWDLVENIKYFNAETPLVKIVRVSGQLTIIPTEEASELADGRWVANNPQAVIAAVDARIHPDQHTSSFGWHWTLLLILLGAAGVLYALRNVDMHLVFPP